MSSLHFLDVGFCLVFPLQRGSPYGMHSHAGAWERENEKFCKTVKYFLSLLKEALQPPSV